MNNDRNYWMETSDEWFTFYKNVDTGEKKKNLEAGDIEVEETVNGYVPVIKEDPDTPDEKEKNSPENRFSIFQIKDEMQREIGFEPLERLQSRGYKVDRKNYIRTYEGVLKADRTLDDLYLQFNTMLPSDFMGHSMSVSDIIVTQKDGEERAFYVDRFGFSEVPEFLHSIDKELYKIGNRYVSLERKEEGIEYTIYDFDSLEKLYQGMTDDPDERMSGLMQKLVDELKMPGFDDLSGLYFHTDIQGNIQQSDIAIPLPLNTVSFRETINEIQDSSEKGTSRDPYKEGEKAVESYRKKTEKMYDPEQLQGLELAKLEAMSDFYVRGVINDYGLDVNVVDVFLFGGRSRGMGDANSDLDIMLVYYGEEKEDSLREIFSSVGNNISICDAKLDIKVFSVSEHKDLADYLNAAEQYLMVAKSKEEKAAEARKKEAVEIKEEDKALTSEALEEDNYNSIDGVPNNGYGERKKKEEEEITESDGGEKAENKIISIDPEKRESVRKLLKEKQAIVDSQKSGGEEPGQSLTPDEQRN